MKKIQRTTIHINPELLAKLQYIAAAEGRAIDEQVLWLIRNCIKAHETEHGEIQQKKNA